MGIKIKQKRAFSVQYHPESTSGPHDSKYLFDQFIDLVKNYRQELVESPQKNIKTIN